MPVQAPQIQLLAFKHEEVHKDSFGMCGEA